MWKQTAKVAITSKDIHMLIMTGRNFVVALCSSSASVFSSIDISDPLFLRRVDLFPVLNVSMVIDSITCLFSRQGKMCS